VELPRERRAAVAKAGADVSSEGVARSLLEPVGRFHPETAGQRLRVEPRGVVAPGGRHLDRLPLVRRPGLPVYRAPRDQQIDELPGVEYVARSGVDNHAVLA